jgi:hypothetical protein
MIGEHLNIIPDNEKGNRMNELSDIWPNGSIFQALVLIPHF